MADKKNTEEVVVNKKADKVLYTYPFSQNPTEEKYVFAAVNGKTIRIRRGTPVLIPKAFAEVLDYAQESELKMIQLATEMQDDFLARVQNFVK